MVCKTFRTCWLNLALRGMQEFHKESSDMLWSTICGHLKTLLSPLTASTEKREIDLESLVPCDYCTKFHSQCYSSVFLHFIIGIVSDENNVRSVFMVHPGIGAAS